ncbi:hypothetical protein JND45_15260, partial [Listeria monocytogenes]|nr:hypothetical protein [Listeria monocytogenes]
GVGDDIARNAGGAMRRRGADGEAAMHTADRGGEVDRGRGVVGNAGALGGNAGGGGRRDGERDGGRTRGSARPGGGIAKAVAAIIAGGRGIGD